MRQWINLAPDSIPQTQYVHLLSQAKSGKLVHITKKYRYKKKFGCQAHCIFQKKDLAKTKNWRKHDQGK